MFYFPFNFPFLWEFVEILSPLIQLAIDNSREDNKNFLLTRSRTISEKENMDTNPGYALSSNSFSVKFVCAQQKKTVSYLLEYETDWKEVMEIILASLETFPASTTRVATLATRKLEAWAMLQEGGPELDLKIKMTFRDDPQRQEDGHKTVVLVFNDLFDTEVFFDVRKISTLDSLVAISAKAVATHLPNLEAIWSLRIPRTLTEDVRAAFLDPWRKHQTLKAKPKVKKMVRMSLTARLKAKNDCPYCKRSGFKNLLQHISRSKSCRAKNERQLAFEKEESEAKSKSLPFW